MLVSRKWSGKTLADHRADRNNWLLSTLGVQAADPARYAWEPVTPGDPDHMEHARRLLHVVADRQRWQAASPEPDAEQASSHPPIFRQPGGRHDGAGHESGRGTTSRSVGGRSDPRYQRAFPTAADRRIEFVRVGRHVRISESALAAFIEAGRVAPVQRPGRRAA